MEYHGQRHEAQDGMGNQAEVGQQGHQLGLSSWSRLPATATVILAKHLRRHGRGFGGRVCGVHPWWRHAGVASMEHSAPRVTTPQTFHDCLRSLGPYKRLRSIQLPPLIEPYTNFATLEIFGRLETLSLSGLQLNEGTTTLAPLPQLSSLTIENSTLNAVMLYSISGLNRLTRLHMKDVHAVNGALAHYCNVLPVGLVSLTMVECPGLTIGSLTSLTQMANLNELNLGLASLSLGQMVALVTLTAVMRLELHDWPSMAHYPFLAAIPNLVSVKSSGCHQQSVAPFLSGTSIDTVAYTNGFLVDDHEPDNVFPTTLKRLSASLTTSSWSFLQRIVSLHDGLESLAIKVPIVDRSIDVHPFARLEKLKLWGDHFEGDALGTIAELRNLKELLIAGCLNLQGRHVYHLMSLDQLQSLSICSCSLSQNACHEIASLHQLRRLEFYYCPNLEIQFLPEMYHLTKLVFGNCPRIDGSLGILLKRGDVQALLFLGLKLAFENIHILEEVRASGILERDIYLHTDIDLPLPGQ